MASVRNAQPAATSSLKTSHLSQDEQGLAIVPRHVRPQVFNHGPAGFFAGERGQSATQRISQPPGCFTHVATTTQ